MTKNFHSSVSTGTFVPLWRPALALVIVALVYFYRIDAPPLWGDEAYTGFEARQVLHCGYPLAYDERNVGVLENGIQVNQNLVCSVISWSQYYVGTRSILIFGDNTLGLRALFVLCGVLTFFPIYGVLKSRVKNPEVISALVMLAPQIVLFQRNARYYSLLILVYAILVWHLSRDYKSARNHFISAALIFVLLFHIHSFAAICSSVALMAFCLLRYRQVLLSYACACVVGFASWVAWSQLLGASITERDLPYSLFLTNFGQWLHVFCVGLWAGIIDMDVVGCLPIILVTALLVVLLIRCRRKLAVLIHDNVYAFVVLNILVQTFATAALIGYESGAQYALLRYEPHLLAFGLVITFALLNAAIENKGLFLLAGVFAVAFNFLTISYWLKPLGRSVPASWFFPVYAEIFSPKQNALDHVIARMKSEEKNAPHVDSVVLPLPPWTQHVLIYYLGDRYLIQPVLEGPNGGRFLARARDMLPAQQINRILGQPDWIVDFLDGLKTVPPGYKLEETIPSYVDRPDDGSRPELTRHTFPQTDVMRSVKLYRLQKP